MKRYYNAAFSIEAAYIVPFMILGIAFLIRTAYHKRNETVAKYTLHEAQEKTLYIEPEYDYSERNENTINSEADYALSAIPALAPAGVESNRTNGKATALLSGVTTLSIKSKICDPEGWMRISTAVTERLNAANMEMESE